MVVGLLLRHRLPLPLLLAVLVAASHGDLSGDHYNTSICKLQPYTCGEVNISYPFYLSDQTADILGNNSSSCGYPGLAIDCVDDEYPILRLGSGPDDSYNVTRIDYTNSTIWLADPDVLDDKSCPFDHNVTLPPTLWLSLSSEEYTVNYLLFFANCSIAVIPDQPYIDPITCPSSMIGYYSFVIPSDIPHQLLSRDCGQVIVAPVRQNASLTIDQQWSISGYRNALKQGFQLEWVSNNKSERCTKCEESSGGCAHSRGGEFVACLCTDGRVNAEECTNGTLSLDGSNQPLIGGVDG